MALTDGDVDLGLVCPDRNHHAGDCPIPAHIKGFVLSRSMPVSETNIPHCNHKTTTYTVVKPTVNAMSLAGKVFIITGGSKGIGKAVAKRVVADGAKVVINYNSDKQAADDFVSELGADRAVAVQADASKIPEIEKIISTAVERFGKIDVVMPNGMSPSLPLISPLELT